MEVNSQDAVVCSKECNAEIKQLRNKLEQLEEQLILAEESLKRSHLENEGIKRRCGLNIEDPASKLGILSSEHNAELKIFESNSQKKLLEIVQGDRPSLEKPRLINLSTSSTLFIESPVSMQTLGRYCLLFFFSCILTSMPFLTSLLLLWVDCFAYIHLFQITEFIGIDYSNY